MDKPTKQIVKPPMIDYHKMIHFIEKKYNIQVRDYHEHYDKSKPDWREYMDFWHWLVGMTEVSNGSDIYLSIDEWLEDEDISPWIKEILNLIKTEFSEDLDNYGGMEVWVSW